MKNKINDASGYSTKQIDGKWRVINPDGVPLSGDFSDQTIANQKASEWNRSRSGDYGDKFARSSFDKPRNQLLSSQISIILSYLPTFILSGFIYPIHNMPQFIQFITYVVPGRYVVTILKGIYSKGIGLEILWVEALLLAVYAGGMTLWAHKRFQKRIG